MTWQPSSQSCPSERSAPEERTRMMCPLRVVRLRPANDSSHVCVDTMLVPLCYNTVIGAVAKILLITGVFSIT